MATMWILILSCYANLASTQGSLYTESVDSCSSGGNQIKNAKFNVSITPNNRTLSYHLAGTSGFKGQTLINTTLVVDGTQVYTATEDPCSADVASLCPISTGPIDVNSNQELPDSAVKRLPSDVLTSTQLNAQFSLRLIDVRGNQTFACFQARMTNGADYGMTGITNGTSTGTSTRSVASASMTPSSGPGSTAGVSNSTASDSSQSSASILVSRANVSLFALLLLACVKISR